MGLSSKMLFDLGINIINILVLFIVVRALVHKPVKKFMDARINKIDTDRSDAEKMLSDAKEQTDKYNALMKESEKSKAEAIKNGEALGKEEARRIVESAEEKAKAIVDSADTKSKAEHDRMLDDAQGEVASLALDIAGKLLARDVTDADNRAIVNQFLSGARSGGNDA